MEAAIVCALHIRVYTVDQEKDDAVAIEYLPTAVICRV